MEDPAGEFPGQPTLVLVNPDDLTRMPNLLQGILQSPGRASRLLYQDGSWCHFEGFQMNLLNGP